MVSCDVLNLSITTICSRILSPIFFIWHSKVTSYFIFNDLSAAGVSLCDAAGAVSTSRRAVSHFHIFTPKNAILSLVTVIFLYAAAERSKSS